MIRFYLCCPERQSMVLIAGAAIRALQRHGSTVKPVCTWSMEELKKALVGTELSGNDVLTCDVCPDGAITALEQLRATNKDTKLIVLADGTVPPTAYLKPSVLPTSLLWKPVTEQAALQSVGEVIAMVDDSGDDAEQEQGFSIEVRGNLKRISYREIVYFEAREKKLWLHMAHKELSFPGTLEKLLEELPEGFLRIHKSFIINRSHMVEVQYGQNLLELSDGTMLPISRSYKADVKAVFS